MVISRESQSRILAFILSMVAFMALTFYSREILESDIFERKTAFNRVFRSVVGDVFSGRLMNSGVHPESSGLVTFVSSEPLSDDALSYVGADGANGNGNGSRGEKIESVRGMTIEEIDGRIFVRGVSGYCADAMCIDVKPAMVRADATKLFHELEAVSGIPFGVTPFGAGNPGFYSRFMFSPLYILFTFITSVFFYFVFVRVFTRFYVHDGIFMKMQSLSQLLEQRDSYTYGHAQRVAKYSVEIAKYLGKPQEFIDELKTSALCHDLGKILMPDEVLFKHGSLTEEEFDHIRKHPIYSYNMVSEIIGKESVANIVRSHHERWDGSGYPDGLSGTNIPEASRILAVADVLDAMTTLRPYRDALSVFDFIAYMKSASGIHFDPALVDVVLDMFASGRHFLGLIPPVDPECAEKCPEEKTTREAKQCEIPIKQSAVEDGLTALKILKEHGDSY